MTDTTTARGTTSAASPSNSPRLPSPPPLPELQLGPRSPSINAPAGELSLDSVAQPDDGAARRIRPGTTASEMARGPPFVPLHQLESPFQLQEYLKSHYSKLTRDESNTVKPLTRETAFQLATPPIQQDTGEPVDRNLWLYELCRFLVQRSNRLIVAFFGDNPPCSSQTCPEMRASEWQYLCAVHEPPKSCCAIDYCCHTLDWAANVLTSTKHFPSRLSLGGEGTNAYQSMRQLTNIFRRVYRIYAHAWFQHREVFWALEQEEGLYKFFKTVCDAYHLIPEDNYTIPPEAEGEKDEDVTDTPVNQTPNMSILRNESQPVPELTESEGPTTATAATTRRHRHTPSTGTQVTMIAEGAEEDEDEGNQTQIVQDVEPEANATSIEEVSISPPKISLKDVQLAQGISRIEMPSKAEVPAPEDPTPTPEHHNSDPFDDTPEASVGEVPTTPDAESSSQKKEATEIEQSDHPNDTQDFSNAVSEKVEENPEEPEEKSEDSDDESMGEIRIPGISPGNSASTSPVVVQQEEKKAKDD